MKIAFIILSHKYPEQTTRLVHSLSLEKDHFFIHIDKRAMAVFNETQRLLKDNSNVFFINRRSACRWGQFSIVNATLECMRDVRKTEENYDYVFLISGQDYPIKPLFEIKHFLEKNQGRQFIDAFSIIEDNRWSDHGGVFQAVRRVFDWHFFLRSRHFHLPLKRKMPNSLIPYGGHQWWALTGECVNYLVDYVDTHPNVTNYFRYTFIPDELFFQTLVCNSRFKREVLGYNLTYTDWLNPNPFPPRVLTVEDFESLKNSDCLFARKFEPYRSKELLKLVDNTLLRVMY